MRNSEKIEMLLNGIEDMKEESNLKNEVLDMLINHIKECKDLEEVRDFMEGVSLIGVIPELMRYNNRKEFFINNLDEIQNYFNTLIEKGEISIYEFNYTEIASVTFEFIAKEFFYKIEDEINFVESMEEDIDNNKKMDTLLITMEELRSKSNLKNEVLDILERYIKTFECLNHVKEFIDEIRQNGCSEAIFELKYNTNIKEFFINNLDEIQNYFNTLIEKGEISINKFNYTEIVWATFEAIANEFFWIIENKIDDIESMEEEDFN